MNFPLQPQHNPIADFVFYENDWMFKEFSRLEFVKSPKWYTFKLALNLFLQTDGQSIVETGTQRLEDDHGGCSTLLFGAFCQRYKRTLVTVDNDQTHMETSKRVTEKYKEYITYVLMDSLEYLHKRKEPIDLLYLDSFDCPLPPENAEEAQIHNLNEIQMAYDKLHNGSILLLDDSNFENGGKTRLSKGFLLTTREWLCLLDHGQTVWIKTK